MDDTDMTPATSMSHTKWWNANIDVTPEIIKAVVDRAQEKMDSCDGLYALSPEDCKILIESAHKWLIYKTIINGLLLEL